MDKTTPSYNLNVVVRETGIKPDTLRAWERRYGLPNPVRTDGGHRLYSDRDIQMIKWFIARQDEGMRISQVVKMWTEMTASGMDPINPSRQSVNIQPVVEGLPDDSALVRLRDSWISACLSFDEYGAEQILAQSFARYPVELVAVEVLQKGLAEIGEGWYEGTVTVQQEHFSSALALRRINALISAAPSPTRREKLLVGTPPGEQHVFSPLLLVLFLRYNGWDVTYLGANVPLEDLAITLEKVSPDLVIYTAALVTTAASLLQIALSPDVAKANFAFGGRAFTVNSELQEYVPGYFLGESLQGVVNVVAEILTGKQKPNQGIASNPNFQQAYMQYTKSIPAINTEVADNYNQNPSLSNLIDMINQQFANNIQAGLVFGNLSVVTPELAWVEELLENNQMPGHLLNDYLKTYYQAVEQIMGESGQVILDWLTEIEI